MSTPPSSPSSFDAGLPALDRLRERVEQAATEIERLRLENEALGARLRELAAEAEEHGEPPALAIGGDPDALRKQIDAFIEAIDQLLAEPTDDALASETNTASTE